MKQILKPLADWDYANLAKNAADAGGVQKFVDGVHRSGMVKGAVITLIAVVGVQVVTRVGKELKQLTYKPKNNRNSTKKNCKFCAYAGTTHCKDENCFDGMLEYLIDKPQEK